MQKLATLRNEWKSASVHDREMFKRYLLDFLAGLVLWFMRSSHPVVGLLISAGLVLFTINPNHWDIRDEKGKVDTHYIAIRFAWFGAAGFVHKLFILITSGN